MTSAHIAPKKWTAREFERQVLDGQPRIAVFDCDGTLWSGDSGSGFMAWSIEQGLLSCSTIDWIDAQYRGYQDGKVSELEICGNMVQMYDGIREQEMRAAAALYMEEFLPSRLFAEMASLVSTLRARGVQIWAVSSTNKWVVAEGVRNLGIPEARILAAEVRVIDEILSGELVDVPTGEGKAASLAHMGILCPDAVFGNSIHDFAMLKIARHAYPVNPSPALVEAAAAQGWGCFSPEAAAGIQEAVGGE